MLDTKLELALMKIISEMIKCPAGNFMMGSPEKERGRGREKNETQHKVTISKPFYIGKYPVTRKLLLY